MPSAPSPCDVPPLAEQFRRHFRGTGTVYETLLEGLADDLEAGGVTATICRGWEHAGPGDVVQLRLLAALFRIVLRGDAPELLPFYPCLGGEAPPEQAWWVAEPVVTAYAEELHAALTVTPQTNEPGRCVALATGLFEAVRRTGLRRIRLLEPGASAGLNLLVDRYRVTGPGWSCGPEDSPLALDTQCAGLHPEPYEIVARRGCDLAPIDAASGEGALRLTSFVWPWQLDRHARLAASLAVVAGHPVVVDRAGAAEWLAARLAEPVPDDVLTVVWHSVTRQYWPVSETELVAGVVAEARERIPLAHVSMEDSLKRSGEAFDVAVDGPEIRVDGDLVARRHFHGPPVVLIGTGSGGGPSGG